MATEELEGGFSRTMDSTLGDERRQVALEEAHRLIAELEERAHTLVAHFQDLGPEARARCRALLDEFQEQTRRARSAIDKVQRDPQLPNPALFRALLGATERVARAFRALENALMV